MKTKLKNLLLVLCMVTCVFAFSACGNEDKNSASDGYQSEEYVKVCSYEVIQRMLDGQLTVDEAVSNEMFSDSISEEEIESFIEAFDSFKKEINGAKLDSDLIADSLYDLYTSITNGEVSQNQVVPEYLKIYETAGFKTKKISYDDNQTVVVSLEGNDRSATVEVSFDKKAKITNITPTAKYTTKEKVTKALMNTLMGMGTVFIVLILISLIIALFGLIPLIMEKKKKKEEVPVIKEAKVPVPVAKKEAPAKSSELNDGELVAVITAAILASSTCNATSADQLIVRSIKKVKRK